MPSKVRSTQSASLWPALLLLVVVAITPPLAFGLGVGLYLTDVRRDLFQRDMSNTARALATAVDEEHHHHVQALRALAASLHVDEQPARLADLHERLAQAAARLDDWLAIELAQGSDGAPVLSTLVPWGTPPPQTGDPETIRQVAASGMPEMSQLRPRDQTFGEPFVLVHVPVHGVASPHVLTVAVRLRALQRILSEQNLQPRWFGAIVSPNLLLAAQSGRRTSALVGEPVIGDIRRQITAGGSGLWRGESSDGEAVYRLHHTSPRSGWTVVLGVPVAVIDTPTSGTRLMLFGVGGGLTALGGMLALLIGKSIARRVRQHEQALQAETAALMEGAPTLIWIARDAAGTVVVGNRALHEFFRQPPNVNFSMALPPEQRPRGFTLHRGGQPVRREDMPLERCLAGGRPVRDQELTVVFDDGDVRHLFGHVVPILRPDGSVRGAVAAFVDVTATKLAEHRARESEEGLRRWAEALPVMAWMTDVEGDAVWTNRLWREFTGRDDEPPGRQWMRELLHPDDLHDTEQAVARALATWTSYEADVRLRRWDGTYRWCTERVVPQFDQAGRPIRWVGAALDIEDRKRAELRQAAVAKVYEAASEAESEWTLIDRVTSVMAGLLGADCVSFGEIDNATGTARTGGRSYPLAMFGEETQQTLRAGRILAVNDVARDSRTAEHAAAYLQYGCGALLCIPIIHRGQYVAYLSAVTATPRSWTDSDAALLRDMADRLWLSLQRLRADVEMRQALVRAEMADRAKATFLAAASHDLRQPFQAMRLYHQVLTIRASDPAVHEVAEKLGDAMTAGESLLNALLDVSRLDAGNVEANIEAVPLADLLASLSNQIAPVARQKGLRFRFVPCSLSVISDPVLLERILRNLVENALKYTSRGGVLVGCRRRADRVLIQVWDTGMGIPPEKLEEIFQDFYQIGNPARDRNLGLGLGLGIVRRTAALLGHHITAQSQPGKGSCFTVAVQRAGLPIVEPAAAQSEAAR